MIQASLAGCEARLQRANRHTQDLDFRLQAYYLDAGVVVEEMNPQRTKKTFKLLNTVLPPIGIGLMVGDILHCYRAALDNLIWELITLTNGASPLAEMKPEFPIFVGIDRKGKPLTSEGLRRRIEGKTHGLSPFLRTVLETMQPCNATHNPADHPLWLLHQLNNVDKHRMVPVLAIPHVVFNYMYRSAKVQMGGFNIADLKSGFVDGAIVGTVEYAAGFDTDSDMHPNLVIDICFGAGCEEATGKSVTSTLNRIQECIHRDIFPKFRPYFV